MPAPYCYDHPRPAVTVDLVVFGAIDRGLRVLLIRRRHDPFAGHWALPGGFLEIDEEIETGARRELQEETGLDSVQSLDMIGVFGAPGRDPRGRTISLAHAAIVVGPPGRVEGLDDASDAAWLPPRSDLSLAFDHQSILDRAVCWLSEQFRAGTDVLRLLGPGFTRNELERFFGELDLPTSEVTTWLTRMRKLGKIGPMTGTKGKFVVMPDR